MMMYLKDRQNRLLNQIECFQVVRTILVSKPFAPLNFTFKYFKNLVFAPLPKNEHEKYMQIVHKYLIDDYKGSEVMKNLFSIIKKNYMIITSNADRHFQINGFDENRIFEIEGNFDTLIECSKEWQIQREHFKSFIQEYSNKNIVVFELGIGAGNRLIKAPLMELAANNKNWKFITLNMPQEINISQNIKDRSIALEGDIKETFKLMLNEMAVKL